MAVRLYAFSKNIFFTLIIVSLFFGVLETILAMIGVRPILLTEDPLMGFSKNIPLFLEESQPDGSLLLKTASNKRMLFNYQMFPKEKESGTYRIFSMGGSTTYGRPYFDNVSFSGWLRAYLQNADPSRKWEVINAGGISYASYRVVNLMNELKKYKPDMFIIYSGQNEFLEERSYGDLSELPSWVLESDSLLSGTRTYAAVKSVVDALRQDKPEKSKKSYELSGEVNEILSHTAGPTSYHRDEKLKDQIITHYRLNLQLMVNIAREAGAKIIFVKPAINLKDMSPFKSEHKEGLGQKELIEWQYLYGHASKLQKAGRLDDALNAYQQASAIDDRYAELHYRIGRVLFEEGKFTQARIAFQRASDEDIAPLRALSSMQRVVEDIAFKNGVPLIDFPQILENAYLREHGHAVFGKEYFVDHVHTNIDGYRLLGLALLDKLAKLEIAVPVNAWGDERIKMVDQQVMATHDAAAQGSSLVNLAKVLAWAGKFEEAYNILIKLTKERANGNAAVYEMLGKSAKGIGRNDEAIDYYFQALAYEPERLGINLLLANLFGEQGMTDKAIKHFQEELRINKDERLFENAHLDMANLLYQKKRYDEAANHLLEILHKNSEHHIAHHYLGVILKEQDRSEEAISHFAEALRLRPDYKEARRSLAEAYLTRGLVYNNFKRDYNRAIAEFDKAIEVSPEYAIAYDNRGYTYLANLGNTIKGCADFKKACELGSCENYNLTRREGHCR